MTKQDSRRRYKGFYSAGHKGQQPPVAITYTGCARSPRTHKASGQSACLQTPPRRVSAAARGSRRSGCAQRGVLHWSVRGKLAAEPFALCARLLRLSCGPPPGLAAKSGPRSSHGPHNSLDRRLGVGLRDPKVKRTISSVALARIATALFGPGTAKTILVSKSTPVSTQFSCSCSGLGRSPPSSSDAK